MKKIFITGGSGYIGSHACVELLRHNHEVMVFDNLSNSSPEVINKVRLIANKQPEFVIGDIRDEAALADAMLSFKPDSVIHFAGLKAVAESLTNPLNYYDVNVHGSLNVLRTMSRVGCKEIVFSSSAAVYGDKSKPPFCESYPVFPVSPYGRSKLMIEEIISDWVSTENDSRAVILRYFNPVGAHVSGLIGEAPNGDPNNLMPIIAQVAQRKRANLTIFGSDYDTRDGTAERDFIHVSDLAIGHVQAIENIANLNRKQILNLGTGKTTSVKELIEVFEKTNRVSIPFLIAGRRAGDVPISFADPTLAYKLIGFECKKSLSEMCADTWNWINTNT